MKKVLHADVQMSTRSINCWSAYILSAMDDLTHSYIFKQKLQNCEPIDLPQLFCRRPQERHLEYWTLWYSETHPREHSSKRAAYHQCHGKLFLQKGHSFALNPFKYMFLNLPRDVIRSTARFRLCVHTLRFETATWNQSNSPTCDLCDSDDVQDEQHVLFHCVNPRVILSAGNMVSVSPNRSPRRVYFLKPEQKQAYFFPALTNRFV
jgi:hypothetical protein